MDSLAFAKSRESNWARLDQLAKYRNLSGAQADEFYQLYQRTTADLAYLRANAPDPDLILRVSATLGRARSKLTTRHSSILSAIKTFFFSTLPYAFYRIRWWSLAVTISCITVFSAVLLIYSCNPGLVESLGTKDQLDYYAKVAFEQYYSEHPHSDFTIMVWTNNAWIALQCVASGVTGIIPLYVLWSNSVAVGQAGAILSSRDLLSEFFQLILPHGQLELFAIFIAGAAGLRLFWAWVKPQNMPRTQALAAEGRHTALVGIGLIFVLLISGMIEGFVTPSALPWPVKIAIGTAALLAVIFWFSYFGRKVAQRNLEQQETNAEIGWTVEYV